jgi:hypothetical protein
MRHIFLDVHAAIEFEQEDDNFTAEASFCTPDVVVFSDPRTKPSTSVLTTKTQKKAFMVSRTPIDVMN